MKKYLLDDTNLGFNPIPKIYTDICPTLRASRYGLKVIEIERGGGEIETWSKNKKVDLQFYIDEAKSLNCELPIAINEQNVKLRTDGTVGTLTTDGSSPKKNNRIMEVYEMNEIINPETDGTCRTIKAQYQQTSKANFKRTGLFGATGVKNVDDTTKTIRIRKLTPTECYKLMGFTAEDCEKCSKAGISNAQLYKQAGNSIVVNVLEAIFKSLGEQYGEFKTNS